MRNRHDARLCRSCQAPMAGHADTCWRCGAEWATERVPPTRLHVIAGGQLGRPADERARAEATIESDRWTNEGGSVGSAAGVARVGAATAGS